MHLLDPQADGGSCVFNQCGAPAFRANIVLSSRASGSKGYICQGCCQPWNSWGNLDLVPFWKLASSISVGYASFSRESLG